MEAAQQTYDAMSWTGSEEECVKEMALAMDGFAAKRSEEREPRADRLSVYWMFDDHTFHKLPTGTIDEIIAAADKVLGDGMLCPIIILAGDKELRRVGHGAHRYSCSSVVDEYKSQVEAWRVAAYADPDIVRLTRSKL